MRIRMVVPAPVRVFADGRFYLVKIVFPANPGTGRIVAQESPAKEWLLCQDLPADQIQAAWENGFEVFGPQPRRIAVRLVGAGFAQTA